MLRRPALSLIILDISVIASKQVGINATGNPPDPSTELDIGFNNRGLLVPRLTTAQRNAITSPTEGLVIFNSSIG